MAYADKTLYITDLDGTLLRSDKTLSEYTVREINARIERGMLFSAASARSLMGIYMVPVEAIHFPVPLVLMNGVLLYFPRRQHSGNLPGRRKGAFPLPYTGRQDGDLLPPRHIGRRARVYGRTPPAVSRLFSAGGAV